MWILGSIPVAATAVGADERLRIFELLLHIPDQPLTFIALEGRQIELRPDLAGAGHSPYEGHQPAELASLQVSHAFHDGHVVEADPELPIVVFLILDVVCHVHPDKVLQGFLEDRIQPVVVFLHTTKPALRELNLH